jgi:hypothetical protein
MKNMFVLVFAGIPVCNVTPSVTRKIPEENKLMNLERKQYEFLL